MQRVKTVVWRSDIIFVGSMNMVWNKHSNNRWIETMDYRDKREEILLSLNNIVAVILNKVFNEHFSCQWFDTMDPSHKGKVRTAELWLFS